MRRVCRGGPGHTGSRLRPRVRGRGYRARVTAVDVVTRYPYLALTRTR